jgi:energy-coupling factor transporter ATP-binding protein EcfA2
MGMGVKCVISAILHIYFLQCKNSKILLLDEAYSNISKEYVADFFDFLYKLCEKLQFKIVLITHDERFVDYANKVYRIDQGRVLEL